MGSAERRITVAGRPQPAQGQDEVRSVAIGPRYFETLAVALVRGAGLTDEDAPQGHVLVNERLVEQFFAGADPVGQRIAVTAPGSAPAAADWVTIAGVAADIRQRPGTEADPIVYVPYASNTTTTATLLVRSRTQSAAVLGAMLREEVAALDSHLPLYRMRTLAQVVREAGWNGRLSRMLILMLTGIAVALATVGLYAVTTHAVSQQTREIGVRMALGARPGQVARLILRRTVFQIALGFAAGVVCTMMLAGTFSSGRAGVSVTDPRSLVRIAAMLTVIALIATLVPIRKATRMDPLQAIRHE
jgi:hypothetical protein